MTFLFEPNAPVARRPIVALAHPGGRFPGLELPPTWFDGFDAEATFRISSSLTPKGDLDARFDAVRVMGAAIRDAALAAFEEGLHPQLIGGDHSLAVGTLAAVTRRFGRVGVVWIDAHADYNTPDTTPSGNPHGMPLAVGCGMGDERLTGLFSCFADPKDVVLVAAREIDPGERELLERTGVWVVGVPELRAMGLPGLVEEIGRRLSGLPVHVSFDFDAMDATFFRATGTPSPAGLTPDESEALLRGLAGRLPVVSSDWVEYDPRHPEAAACAKTAARMHTAFGQALDAAAGKPRDGGSQTASCA